MATASYPSNLELQALSVLWHRCPSTIHETHELTPEGRSRAHTESLSVMQNIGGKFSASSIPNERALVYETAISQEMAATEKVRDSITHIFGGRFAKAVLAILSTGT